MVRPRMRRWGSALVAATTLGLLAACGSSGSESASGLQEVTLRLHFAPDGSMSTLYAASALGYFEDEGLDLQILPGKGSQFGVNEVAQGKSDFATAGAVNVMLGADAGQDVESIGMWTGRSSYGFLIPEDSSITNVGDLAGKTIVVGTGTPFAALLPSVLESNGVAPDSVTVLSVDASALVQTYASGEGDAIATAIPFAQPLVATSRPSTAMPWSDLGYSIPDYSFVANSEEVKKDPELAQKFLRAMLKGIAADFEDPTIGLDALKKAQPEVDGTVAAAQLAGYQPYYCSDDPAITTYGTHDATEWGDAVDKLEDAALLKNSPDPSTLFTNDLLPSVSCPLS